MSKNYKKFYYRNVTHTFTCTYNLPTGQSKTVEVKKESVINITESETEDGEEEEVEGEIVEDGELDRKLGFKDEDEKEDTGDEDEEEEDDEPGFFTKIIDWFKGLFSGDDTEEDSKDLEDEEE